LKFHEIARSFGYHNCYFYNSLGQLKNEFPSILSKNKSVFIEIKCRIGARKNLGRPDRTPAENKFEFMKFLEKE
jgi:phosphonopyruvate decarboxylase